jgi:hypothetical protein
VLFGATDFFTAAAGVFSGVIEGVTVFAARLVAYGSAVAGRTSSGRRIGLRMVPPMSEPVPVGFDDSADLVELPSADGGRAVDDDAVETFDVVLEPNDFEDCDFIGV